MAKDDTNPAKILIWDVETSTLNLSIDTYSLKNYTKYYNPDDITRDWVMLGAAWKPLGEQVRCVSVSSKDPLNDYMVIKTLHEQLEAADILVGHNADRFDIRKFNTRALLYDLPPITKKKTIDTLKIAKKYFGFTSNKLSFIAKHLKLDMQKDESPDWGKILAGCPDELAYMRKYNKKDVCVNELIYLKLRPYIDNHPNVNIYSPQAEQRKGCCPSCGSHDTYKKGFRRSETTGKITGQRMRCKSCNRSFMSK